jgi:membrane associated rhomboid family serine protease
VSGATGPVELDGCAGCRVLWFDPAELARVATGRSPAPTARSRAAARSLPPEARAALAELDLRRIREQADRDADDDEGPPDSTWQAVAAFLGMPFAEGLPAASAFPWASWGILALMILATLAGMRDPAGAAAAWGLLPSAPFRAAGLTFVTSFLLHANLAHLAGNAWFLLLFGRSVEAVIGTSRFLVLVALSALAGDVAHLLLDTRPDVPLLGASGGISGVLVYAALRFPRARLGFLLAGLWLWWSGGRLVRWIRFPIWAGLAAWLALQVVVALGQRVGCSGVSGLAHLGGAAAGLALWAWWRRASRPAAASVPNA